MDVSSYPRRRWLSLGRLPTNSRGNGNAATTTASAMSPGYGLMFPNGNDPPLGRSLPPGTGMYYSAASMKPGTSAGTSDPFEAVMRPKDWLTWVFRLVVLVIAATALGLAIWGVVSASNNSKRIDDIEDDSGGVMMKRMLPSGKGPTAPSGGHTLRWDEKQQAWIPSYGHLTELQDVALGSEQLPLEDGDLLQWQDGKITNARDRILEQELGHHLDTRFVNLRNGHIMIRNQTAGQWRNVPLGALLSLSGLSDVKLHEPDDGRTRHSSPLRDQSQLVYDRKRNVWVPRAPLNRAWLRFCPPAATPDPSRYWGHLDPPLTPGRWSPVRPVSGAAGVYLIDIYSHGDMQVSRKHVSVTTPAPRRGATSRPSDGRPYRLRATISAVGLPAGAWGFLVGSEAAPADGGFMVNPGIQQQQQQQQWSIESVRQIPDNRRIVLAYQMFPHSKNDGNGTVTSANTLIQCFQLSVEEL